MKLAWFRPWGPTYRPATWQGAALVLAAAALCVGAFVLVDRHAHSASDTLYGVVPTWLVALGALHGIAAATTGPRSPRPSSRRS